MRIWGILAKDVCFIVLHPVNTCLPGYIQSHVYLNAIVQTLTAKAVQIKLPQKICEMEDPSSQYVARHLGKRST